MDLDSINWYSEPVSVRNFFVPPTSAHYYPPPTQFVTPDDHTLPPPWKEVIDGATGRLYYWNPDTNHTQYDRPVYLVPCPSPYPSHSAAAFPPSAIASSDHVFRSHYPNLAPTTYEPTYSAFPSFQPQNDGSPSIPTFQSPSTPIFVPQSTYAQYPSQAAAPNQFLHNPAAPDPNPQPDSTIQACLAAFQKFNHTLTTQMHKCQSQLQDSRVKLVQIRETYAKLRASVTSAHSAPQYAPADMTLPAPWRGLIDGSSGSLYYWNPDTNETQYERPCPEAPQTPPIFTCSVSDDHHATAVLRSNSIVSGFNEGNEFPQFAQLAVIPNDVTTDVELHCYEDVTKQGVEEGNYSCDSISEDDNSDTGDCDVPLETLPVFIRETKVAAAPGKHASIVSLMKDEPILDDSMNLLVSDDLAKLKISKSIGFDLSCPSHSHASDEALSESQLTNVAPGILSELAIIVELDIPEACQERSTQFALDFYKSGHSDAIKFSFDSTMIAANLGSLNAGIGKYNLCIGGKYEDLQLHSTMKLEPIWATWKSVVHAKLASATDAKELFSITREGLKLPNGMLQCFANAHSQARSMKWLFYCFLFCPCETTSALHRGAFAKIGLWRLAFKWPCPFIISYSLVVQNGSYSVNADVKWGNIFKQNELHLVMMLTSSMLVPFLLSGGTNMFVTILECFLGCHCGGGSSFNDQDKDASSVEACMADGTMLSVNRDLVMDCAVDNLLVENIVHVPHFHHLLLDEDNFSQVLVLSSRNTRTLFSPRLVISPVLFSLSLPESSMSASRHMELEFELFTSCYFVVGTFFTTLGVTKLSARLLYWWAGLEITPSSREGYLYHWSLMYLTQSTWYLFVPMKTTSSIGHPWIQSLLAATGSTLYLLEMCALFFPCQIEATDQSRRFLIDEVIGFVKSNLEFSFMGYSYGPLLYGENGILFMITVLKSFRYVVIHIFHSPLHAFDWKLFLFSYMAAIHLLRALLAHILRENEHYMIGISILHSISQLLSLQSQKQGPENGGTSLGIYCSSLSCPIYFQVFMPTWFIACGFVAIDVRDIDVLPQHQFSVPMWSPKALMLFLPTMMHSPIMDFMLSSPLMGGTNRVALKFFSMLSHLYRWQSTSNSHGVETQSEVDMLMVRYFHGAPSNWSFNCKNATEIMILVPQVGSIIDVLPLLHSLCMVVATIVCKETSGATKGYGMKTKVRLFDNMLQGVHWVVHKLAAMMQSNSRLDRYAAAHSASKIAQEEKYIASTSWHRELQIVAIVVALNERNGLFSTILQQKGSSIANLMGNPGSEFSFCKCVLLIQGNMCQPVYKANMICASHQRYEISMPPQSFNKPPVSLFKQPMEDSLAGMIKAWEVSGTGSAEVNRIPNSITSVRPEDMPLLKGGGMLRLLHYNYILQEAIMFIYLNGLTSGFGSDHILNGYLGLC